MKTSLFRLVVSLGLLGGACADNSQRNPGNATISCDQSISGTRSCVEYACADTDSSEVEHACQMISDASAGGGCAQAGATGGCTLSTPGAGQAGLANCTRTLWFYTLTTPDVMAICATLNGEFVAP